MERARVRGTHLPPEESRRKQPGKGAAGSQTVVETVQHSLALSTLQPLHFYLSLCSFIQGHIWQQQVICIQVCHICGYRHKSFISPPLPSTDISEQESETGMFIYLSTPAHQVSHISVLCILCYVEIILVPLRSPSDFWFPSDNDFLFVEKYIDIEKYIIF